MSPSIRPSRCRSIVAVRLPLITMSGPSTEKVESAIVPLPDGRSVESCFFENIGRYLQEWARVDGLAMEANLEMQMRTGGTAGAADGSDHLASRDGLADPRAERGHVGVTRMQAIAMV